MKKSISRKMQSDQGKISCVAHSSRVQLIGPKVDHFMPEMCDFAD